MVSLLSTHRLESRNKRGGKTPGVNGDGSLVGTGIGTIHYQHLTGRKSFKHKGSFRRAEIPCISNKCSFLTKTSSSPLLIMNTCSPPPQRHARWRLRYEINTFAFYQRPGWTAASPTPRRRRTRRGCRTPTGASGPRGAWSRRQGGSGNWRLIDGLIATLLPSQPPFPAVGRVVSADSVRFFSPEPPFSITHLQYHSFFFSFFSFLLLGEENPRPCFDEKNLHSPK